ncbi:hypothetical protein K1719_031453 [Acacia pycnantha]|nr:hypothetical protein K1719_031453 [Acacia pycnantha]
MNNMEESTSELHGMLKTAELSLKKRHSTVLFVQEGRGMKRKAKKEKPPKDRVCFFYNELCHLKRNCKLYLEDLEKNKKDSGAIASSIYVIDILFSTSSTWVLDTTCGSHI